MKIEFNTGKNEKDCLNCIASAGMYSVFSGKAQIDADELFFGIINYINTQDFGPAFFELIGLKKINTIITYANHHYIVDLTQQPQHITAHVQIAGRLQSQITAAKVTEQDNFIALLAIACASLSPETLGWCKEQKIWLNKAMKYLRILAKWSSSSNISSKKLFDLLALLQSEYNISISELSNMDIVELQIFANELSSELPNTLQNTSEAHINKELISLLLKLMETIQMTISEKNPINKRFNPIVDIGGLPMDEETAFNEANNSHIEIKEQDEDWDTQKKLTIDYFGTDLTKQALNNELDPVIGREREINQIIYTLLRKTKNSPMLIGEAGVGKTAIVEGLAIKLAQDDVPERLKGYRVVNLDVTGMIAGTKYRGEFEQRLKSVLEEASDPLNQIIVFIDEIHTIMGAGGHDNNDMANSIKPLLSRGKIKLIGATTFDEYQKHIEKDAALKRRFQEINVDEPKPMDTVNILKGLKERFEQFHDVNISDSAIEHAVGLSVRYILNKHLPDKAIDLIDEACARKSVLLSKLERNDDYTEAMDALKEVETKIQGAVGEQDYFKAAELKQTELELKNKIKSLKNKSSMPSHLRPIITEEDIGRVLSDKLGIPTEIINESEVEKLTHLKTVFDSHIFGQDEAVDKVIKSIQKSRLSVIPKNKPIASFLFLWPSGVGKTYTAKMIAEHYFHDPKSLIRIDMSEYMEKYSVSKIIWSAPGYVGYDEGGSLTEQIRRKPYSVLLFDEIEKADKSVLNILLQILDEGQLKDSKGRIIDFKNTIVIMTSNIWSEFFSQKGKQIGFAYKQDEAGDHFEYEHVKGLVLDKLNDFLSPELLNRIDHKIVFSPLDYKQLTNIFMKLYTQFAAQRKANDKAIVPTFTDEEVQEKVKELYDPQYGARPIEQYIYNSLEDQVIWSLLTHK